MKKILTAALAFTLQFGIINSAFAEIEIITVDIVKLYEGYYKTVEANTKLQNRFAEAKTQMDTLVVAGEAEVETYKTMFEQAQNPALSDAAREEAEKDADNQMQKIQQIQQEIQYFRQNTQNQLATSQNSNRQFMLEEIKTIVHDVAISKGADLAFDTSSGMSVGLPSVLFANSSYDVTDEVMVILNADAPPPVEETEASVEDS